MSGGKQGVEYEIGAKDTTGAAVSSATSKVKSFASAVGGNLMNIKAGFEMLASAARSMLSKLQKAFRFETMTVQFKTLVGSMDEARAHMAMLQKMGDTPPFSLEAFAEASRSMMVMSEGALGFEKSLTLVGDAAAATGQPLESLAHQVGLAYATIRDGEPVTRATMALRNMGVITPEVAARLEDLQNAGAQNAEIWAELEKALGKFKGAMAETERTGEGLVGAISAQWDDAVRGFGGAVLEATKGPLSRLLAKMRQLNEDGTIQGWAGKAVEAFERVGAGAEAVIGPISKVLSFGWKTIKGQYESMAQGIGGFAGALAGGGSLMDALKEGVGGFKQGWVDAFDLDGAEAAKLERNAKKFAERRAREKVESEVAAAKAREKEEVRIRQSLAAGQRKIDERNIEAARRKAEEEMERLRPKMHPVQEVKVAAPEPPRGGGDAAIGTGGEYGRLAAELAAEEREIRLRRSLYQKTQYHKRQQLWDEATKRGGLELDRHMDPYEPWRRSIEDANDRWGAQLESLRDRRRQLDEQYGNGALAGSDAANRTANACEGILRHFERGRFG